MKIVILFSLHLALPGCLLILAATLFDLDLLKFALLGERFAGLDFGVLLKLFAEIEAVLFNCF